MQKIIHISTKLRHFSSSFKNVFLSRINSLLNSPGWRKNIYSIFSKLNNNNKRRHGSAQNVQQTREQHSSSNILLLAPKVPEKWQAAETPSSFRSRLKKQVFFVLELNWWISGEDELQPCLNQTHWLYSGPLNAFSY